MVEFPPARQSSAHSDQTSRLLASVETYLVDVEAIPLGVEDLHAFLADACNTYDAASKAPPIPSSELPLEPSSALRIVKGDDVDFTVTLKSPETHITTVGTWSSLLSDVAGLKENVKDLTQDVKALWKENKALKEDTGELRKKNKALKEDMGEVRKENKALKEDVGELVEADKVLRELRTDSE
ncbi:putative coiled-coil protein [Rhodotorula toruloides ATCC 204091]|uniref:Putative coiled-coil protein n=1 Tax=Rhodotorula toruloides TaxID=5286 RepID=A0A0K3CRA9_RHOTO|nr:putative coiled-coil protein [Rhodotorula toruloides ATCC 204091]KAK4333779.1 putative coiled-coil protein [Rhodotorula toruloides]PRQ70252.1 putative coiled-coil protein [Rhodotorula toruloides]